MPERPEAEISKSEPWRTLRSWALGDRVYSTRIKRSGVVVELYGDNPGVKVSFNNYVDLIVDANELEMESGLSRDPGDHHVIIGRIRKDPQAQRIVARDLREYARLNGGPFMYVSLHGRGSPGGESITIYPGLRGQLCNVNPNTGHTVVVVAVAKVEKWADKILGGK